LVAAAARAGRDDGVDFDDPFVPAAAVPLDFREGSGMLIGRSRGKV
jgi:hypothetical protein